MQVLHDCPELKHFHNNWPIKVLIQQYLKNSLEQHCVATRQQSQHRQNQDNAEIEFMPSPVAVTQTVSKPSTATTISVATAKLNATITKFSTAAAKASVAKPSTATKSIAPVKSMAATATKSSTTATKSAAKVNTAKSTTAPKKQQMKKMSAQGLVRQINLSALTLYITTTQAPAAAKSHPLFNAMSNQYLANPVLELLGLESTAPKAQGSKGNNKKRRHAKHAVSKASSSKNSNKHKQPAADNDVEEPTLVASVLICHLDLII